ncbi:ABC transporter permease [uncultured Negativibacillus sp.]|uniref:ABC transporter permease n=1 Tax=uncultured Negativibacillus sp. TaxID=1980696 RepID=UPI0026014B31|nr:ABC transporter permease [uncultured Negativibacillus sp.]
MGKYILKRLLVVIPTLLFIVFVVFFILNITPGDPGRIMLGTTATQEQVDMLNESLGVNRPLLVRYVDYIWDALHGDFGTSYTFNVPVARVVMPKLPTALRLAILSVCCSALLGIPLGILSAVKKHSLIDNALTVLALFLASVPGFWLGLMLMLWLSLSWGLLPSSGVGTWQHYIMPVMTLALPSAAFISRLTRTTMLDSMNQDYIRTAKGKGARDRRVIFGHALRNALIPVITQLGMNFAGLLGGAMITEIVFGLPGFGNAIVAAIKAKDVPLTMFAVIFLSTTFMLIMLVVDLIYAFIDPRIKAQYE